MKPGHTIVIVRRDADYATNVKPARAQFINGYEYLVYCFKECQDYFQMYSADPSTSPFGLPNFGPVWLCGVWGYSLGSPKSAVEPKQTGCLLVNSKGCDKPIPSSYYTHTTLI